MSDTLDTKLDEIIASIAGDVYDYATDADSDRDEAVYSATQSHKKAMLGVIEQENLKTRAETVKRCNVSGQRTKCPHCGEPAHWVNPLGGASCIVCNTRTPF